MVLLDWAVDDLERGRIFYEKQQAGTGDYFVDSLMSDIGSLLLFHGVHRNACGCFRMLASRFPFGIYYVEGTDETRVVAVLDLRRDPVWIKRRVSTRRRRTPQGKTP